MVESDNHAFVARLYLVPQRVVQLLQILELFLKNADASLAGLGRPAASTTGSASEKLKAMKNDSFASPGRAASKGSVK
jgi:hypothetical protein